MADDVDPHQSLPADRDLQAETVGDTIDVAGSGGLGAPTTTRRFEPVEIAMMEIEIVEFEAVEGEPVQGEPLETASVKGALVDGEPVEGEPVEGEPTAPEPVEEDHPDQCTAVELDPTEDPESDYDTPESHAKPEPAPESDPDPEPEKVVLQVTTLDVVAVDTIEPGSGGDVEPDDSMEPVDALPTMADLDRVASELDDIDARLAALDEQRP